MHKRTPGKEDLRLVPVKENLTKQQARDVEQALIDKNGGALSTNENTTLLNKINSISPAQANYAERVRNGNNIMTRGSFRAE